MQIDLSTTTPSQLVCWLAAQCHDGTQLGLGHLGKQTLHDLRDLALLDQAERIDVPAVDLGAMGAITLDELRAVAQDARTLSQIVGN